MNILIIGDNGWIGSKYKVLLEKRNISYITTKTRAENIDISYYVKYLSITHVLYCAGRTYGTLLDGTKYSTIDYLQHEETLYQNINDNLYSPVFIALQCDKYNIHFTYIGTGCIYTYSNEELDILQEYDNNNTAINEVKKINEIDSPNFMGSHYSLVKSFTDKLLTLTNALILRIRMPITDEIHPRNFITKITTYKQICSIPNSMSVLNDLLPVSIEMICNKEVGTFNFVNTGVISHNEILELYKSIVDPSFVWNNFSIKEQNEILLSKRSNNYLDNSKLLIKYPVKDIKDAIIDILYDMCINHHS